MRITSKGNGGAVFAGVSGPEDKVLRFRELGSHQNPSSVGFATLRELCRANESSVTTLVKARVEKAGASTKNIESTLLHVEEP
jgi:hypothetical protein